MRKSGKMVFLGNWSFISLRNLCISVFDAVLLKVELEMWFLQFLRLNLPENCSFQTKIHGFHQICSFRPKSTIFVKIHSFHQNPWFSSKSAVFIKICSFHWNPQFRRNPWFSSKSAVFIEICGFPSKTADFHQNRDFWHFSQSFQEHNIYVKRKTTCLER